ncbi:hypothetical protein RYX36_018117 [Vicia faba]
MSRSSKEFSEFFVQNKKQTKHNQENEVGFGFNGREQKMAEYWVFSIRESGGFGGVAEDSGSGEGFHSGSSISRQGKDFMQRRNSGKGRRLPSRVSSSKVSFVFYFFALNPAFVFIQKSWIYTA